MQGSHGTYRQTRKRIYALTLLVWMALGALSLGDWFGAVSESLPRLLQGVAWRGVPWFAPLLAIAVGVVGMQSLFRLQILDIRERRYFPLVLAPMATLWLSEATVADYLTLSLAPLLMHVTLKQPSRENQPMEALYLGLIVGGISLFSAQALLLFVPFMGGMMCMRSQALRSTSAFLLGCMSVLLMGFPIFVLKYPKEIGKIVFQWMGGFDSPFLGGEQILGAIAGQWTFVAWGLVGLFSTLWGWEGIRHLGTIQRNRAIAMQVITLLLIPFCLVYGGVASPLSLLLAYTLSVSVARALGSLSPRVEPYVIYSFAFVWLLLSLLP